MLATYRTEKGAARYAGEIMRKFPSVKAAVVPNGFAYGVLVTLADGRKAMADKRPRHYGEYGSRKNYRIATRADI